MTSLSSVAYSPRRTRLMSDFIRTAIKWGPALLVAGVTWGACKRAGIVPLLPAAGALIGTWLEHQR